MTDAYARGVLAAQTQFAENTKNELESELANLRRVTVKRDSTQSARDGYERCYERVVNMAERVASITGGEVEIPAFLPPPTSTAQFVRIGAPASRAEVVTRPDGTVATVDMATAYKETRGAGKSGKGLPKVIPGSATDTEWLGREEGKRATAK